MKKYPHALQDATEIFLQKFPDTLHIGQETIGVEPEMLAVDKNGDAVSWDIVSHVFQDFIKTGWKPIIDTGTEKIVGVEGTVNTYQVSFGTDVGYAIIEVQLPPAKTLFEAQKIRAELLRPLIQAFKKYDCLLLGYGVLPKNLPHKKLLSPKGRYVFFEQDSTNDYIAKKDGTDLHFFTMSAAAHTHFGVDKKRIILATNVLNQLGGVFILLGANAPIWKGNVDPQGNRAIREWFWDGGWGRRRPKQIGILPPMSSLADYVEHLASFEPQMIKIGQEYLSLVGSAKTVKTLLENGEATATNVRGEKKLVTISPEYILFVGGFAWYAARPAWPGTVESRISCQQPPYAPLAMSALALGLIANLEKTHAFINTKPFSYWQSLRMACMYQGFHHPDAEELGTNIIRLSNEGLENRGHNEEIFLEEITKRWQDKKAPAEIAVEKFKKNGIEGLIQHVAITDSSLQY